MEEAYIMAGKVINREWAKAMKESANLYESQGIVPETQVFSWNVSAQWYIKMLVGRSIPFKVIQRGAGVKEVVVKSKKCPTCKGKGYLPDEE
jgi:hypothetical protein